MPACNKSFLHGGNPGGAAQQSVERGNLAELLVAQQGKFFVGFALRRFLHRGEAVFDEAGAGIALVDQGDQRRRRRGQPR